MEIERKFLVDGAPPPTGGSGALIRQGYLSGLRDESEVRVRAYGADTLLTVKRPLPAEDGVAARTEVEVAISPAAFEALWQLTAGDRIEKRRSRIALGDAGGAAEAGGLTAELDVYAGALEGLRTVEVEFADAAAARAFVPPPWFGRELTGDSRWSNRHLAAHGAPAPPG